MQNQNTAREQHSEFTCHRNNKEIYKAKGLKIPTKTENIRNKISREQYQGHICIIHHYQNPHINTLFAYLPAFSQKAKTFIFCTHAPCRCTAMPFSFISKKGGTMRIHFPDEKLKKETFANQQSVNKTRFVCKGFVSAVPPVKQISSFLGFYAIDAPVRMFLLQAHGKGL